VCQENCPISPKAIITQEYFSTLPRYAKLTVKQADAILVGIDGSPLEPGRFASGDYYLRIQGDVHSRNIVENTADSLKISSLMPLNPIPTSGTKLEIQIRLQRPVVDITRCIGCGVCEHECPVRGKRAIRVSAENESRHREHALLLKSGEK
jgi:NAD-dependent dihydropyrimidine dehydrogenase PreA subunit